ncbi:MAG: hypothetical protein IPO19_13590, partial [Rhodoferax sp.]|nr:hypothetical protein [Rhodoferax sp.]
MRYWKCRAWRPGSVKIRVRPMAVSELFDQLRETLSATATAKGLRLRVRPSDVDPERPIAAASGVLLNLVGNAIRYTDIGTVLLACRPWGDGRLAATLRCGTAASAMRPSIGPGVFKGSFSGRQSTAQPRAQGGWAWGLNIVQRTTRLLGAPPASAIRPGLRYAVHDQVPVGSAIRSSARRRSALPMGEQFDGLKVLVVEDDAGQRRFGQLVAILGLPDAAGRRLGSGTGAGGRRVATRRHREGDFRLRDAEHRG